MVNTVSGSARTIEVAFQDAISKITSDAQSTNQVIDNIRCISYKEIVEYKRGNSTTKRSNGIKGQKKWATVYNIYIRNDDNTKWIEKVVIPEDVDNTKKAEAEKYARLIALQSQRKTCVRIEKQLVGDVNNGVEETYTPAGERLGIWNFEIEYEIVTPQSPQISET